MTDTDKEMIIELVETGIYAVLDLQTMRTIGQSTEDHGGYAVYENGNSSFPITDTDDSEKALRTFHNYECKKCGCIGKTLYEGDLCLNCK